MNMPHPSSVLKREWTELIRANSLKAEKDKRPTKKQLDLIDSQDWFKLLVPAVYGGKQKACPEAIQLFEALAWAEGSMGWTIGLSSVAGWQGAFIGPEVAKIVFEEGKVAFSCGRTATGKAEVVEGGYRISGKWQHISASIDTTTVICNCVITKEGVALPGENRKHQVLSFPLYKNEINLVSTWKSMGLLAACSDGFEIKDLFVSTDRAFKTGENQRVNGKLYHFPHLQLVEAGVAANISGMTIHFIDLCREYFINNTPGSIVLSEDPVMQGDLGKLPGKFDVAREKLFYGVSILWQSCIEAKPLYPSVLNKVSAATNTITQVSREVVNALYPHCGIRITETDSEINRVWRDLQTAYQHSQLVFGV